VATKTWAGSPTNDASDPSAWTPAGAPQPGDTLQMGGGTMNISGDALAGDTLTLNVVGETETFNVAGTDRFDLQPSLPYAAGANVTVNLADGGQWVGGFQGGVNDRVTVSASGSGQWSNTSTHFNGPAVIDADVTGTGTIDDILAHSTGTVEFKKAVGAGQAVTVSGYAQQSDNGVVQVDDPNSYQAATALGFGELRLEGLEADSYNQDNGRLTLWQGDTVVLSTAVMAKGPRVGIDWSVHTVTWATTAVADALLTENSVVMPFGLPRSTSK